MSEAVSSQPDRRVNTHIMLVGKQEEEEEEEQLTRLEGNWGAE